MLFGADACLWKVKEKACWQNSHQGNVPRQTLRQPCSKGHTQNTHTHTSTHTYAHTPGKKEITKRPCISPLKCGIPMQRVISTWRCSWKMNGGFFARLLWWWWQGAGQRQLARVWRSPLFVPYGLADWAQDSKERGEEENADVRETGRPSPSLWDPHLHAQGRGGGAAKGQGQAGSCSKQRSRVSWKKPSFCFWTPSQIGWKTI